jgi:hypothetical protein
MWHCPDNDFKSTVKKHGYDIKRLSSKRLRDWRKEYASDSLAIKVTLDISNCAHRSWVDLHRSISEYREHLTDIILDSSIFGSSRLFLSAHSVSSERNHTPTVLTIVLQLG